MPDGDDVSIEVLNAPVECPGEKLQRFVFEVLEHCGRSEAGLCVAFMDDDAIQTLNREYCNIDSPTDVLAFPAGLEGGSRYLGDIAVSVPTARRQAEELGHPLLNEIMILVAHGILHLLGHDHETDSGEMARLEADIEKSIIGAPRRNGAR